MKITIYTTPSCPYSKLAKDYLIEKGFEFEEKDAGIPEEGQEMVKISGQAGVPVIDIDGQIIVGWDKDRIDRALGIIPRKIATETVKMEDLVDPKAEEARTLERIMAMLPPKIKRPNYNLQRGGGNRDICWVDGQNNFRKKVVELLPQIIAEVQKAKMEEVLKIIEDSDLQGDSQDFVDGFNFFKEELLSKLK
jgi:glutaredoxin